jgi:dTDP-4-dehydrorhamnose reductase
MNIVLLGSDGNLGIQLEPSLRILGNVVPLTRKQLDITDEWAVMRTMEELKPDVMVNAAAYNNVDAAQKEARDIAHKVNTLAPEYLARAAASAKSRFMHFSTDYVFGGSADECEYEEDAEVNPVSYYGETKALGEAAALAAHDDVLTCRLSKIFGEPGRAEMSKPSFVSIMLKLAKERDELDVLDREIGMPTYTRDIARAATAMLEGQAGPGIYHLVNEGEGVTWHAFAKEIFDAAGIDIRLNAVTTFGSERPAKRPECVILKNTKVPPLRAREDALKRYLSKGELE